MLSAKLTLSKSSPNLRKFRLLSFVLFASSISILSSCGGDKSPHSDPSSSSVPSQTSSVSASNDGADVVVSYGGGEPRDYESFKARATQKAAVNAQTFLDEHKVNYLSQLSYNPMDSANLDLIQSSPLAMNENELHRLEENGFVISTRQEYPTFLRGYADIYKYHLPIYVSADAILEALHQSYDELLMELELELIIPELTNLLDRLHQKAFVANLEDPSVLNDLTVYLGVARSLLQGQLITDGGSAAQADIQKFFNMAQQEQGNVSTTIFGVERKFDFSQFTPRGHYTQKPLSDYFKAMMWLGRIDFRLIETQPDGSTKFYRRQYEAMSALHGFFSEQDHQAWQKIESVLQAFVGKSDYMTLAEMSSLKADVANTQLYNNPPTDENIAQAIVAGDYGKQLIASHIMFVEKESYLGLPLNRSFALFGQRYIVDSEVFSKVVFDRLQGSIKRMLPNPLDAAFAVFNNPQAAALLTEELEKYEQLPGALNRLNYSVQLHESDFWNANLYNLWLSALSTLSPKPDMTQEVAEGLPEVAATEAWGRRILNTQLGSWAQLRHDTLLYAKQSFSGIPGCEFPDAYVEPYPEFFEKIKMFADKGLGLSALVAEDSSSKAAIESYFTTLLQTAALFKSMAENQRRGEPHTQEQLAFINDAIRIEEDDNICAIIEKPNGWYEQLFYGSDDKSITFDPTIADVHTSPGDAQGNIVGWVKHVATGRPRLTVVAVKNCNGVGLYSGMSYSYFEKTTENFKRYTDEEWAGELRDGLTPGDVPWIEPVLAQ